MSDTRIERDSLGDVEVPADRYWGAQTERARRNFPVSGLTLAAPLHRRAGADQARGGAGQRASWGSSTSGLAEAIAQRRRAR